MKRRLCFRGRVSGGAAFALATVLAAAVPAHAASEPKLAVAATTGMVADVVSAVGGTCVAVTALIADGSDPHSWQPAPSDVQAMQQAGLIAYSGLSLEGRLGDILARFGRTKPVLAVAEAGIAEADRLVTQDEYGVDPHAWMDAGLWGGTATAVAATLTELRPGCAAEFSANAARFSAQAGALHGWIASSIATIPDAQRQLVTAHDAFGYFSRAYSIPVAAIQGLSTETEASIADIESVARTVIDSKVPAVFIETTISPRTMEAVLDAVKAGGGTAVLGPALYSDAMGAAGTPEGTWIGMMRANTLAITTALGGTPAPWPAELDEWAKQAGVSP
jgi:manganese/zinc/iron transport system substrate-binding protein